MKLITLIGLLNLFLDFKAESLLSVLLREIFHFYLLRVEASFFLRWRYFALASRTEIKSVSISNQLQVFQ